MNTQTLSIALEVLYWIALVAVTLAILRHKKLRGLSQDQRAFQRGVEDGKQFREAGMSDRGIEALLSSARGAGTYGPYESGVAQILKEPK